MCQDQLGCWRRVCQAYAPYLPFFNRQRHLSFSFSSLKSSSITAASIEKYHMIFFLSYFIFLFYYKDLNWCTHTDTHVPNQLRWGRFSSYLRKFVENISEKLHFVNVQKIKSEWSTKNMTCKLLNHKIFWNFIALSHFMPHFIDSNFQYPPTFFSLSLQERTIRFFEILYYHIIEALSHLMPHFIDSNSQYTPNFYSLSFHESNTSLEQGLLYVAKLKNHSRGWFIFYLWI